MTTLELTNLTKAYNPDETAVSGLNLTVEAGEMMVLLGPSGCGKTTTLRMIAGLLAPTNGDIQFDGVSMLTVPPEKRGVAMVFQEHALFPFMTVGENVGYGLKLRKINRSAIQARVAEVLTAVRLSGFEQRSPASLSGGQRQRVALARALVVRPRLLLLDEPLSNLDRGLRDELRSMISNLQKKVGITTLFVTHDQAEAVAIADRIGVLMNGRLQQAACPRQLYEKPATAQIARFFGARNFLAGIKCGQSVDTDIGPIAIEETPVSDGPVLLSIRPESIEIGANGYNNFQGVVNDYSYRVPASACQVRIKNIPFYLSAPSNKEINVNQPINLHLPKNRICVLPPEPDCSPEY
jgi:ABC-type Fe3+/spermidine/putrescine transport system ATPase subunit